MAKKTIQNVLEIKNFTLNKEYLTKHLSDIVYFRCSSDWDDCDEHVSIKLLMVQNGKLVGKTDSYYRGYAADYEERAEEAIKYLAQSEEPKQLFSIEGKSPDEINAFRKGVNFEFRNGGWLICPEKGLDWDGRAFVEWDLTPYFSGSVSDLPVGLRLDLSNFVEKNQKKIDELNQDEQALIRALVEPKIDYFKDWLNAVSYLKYLDHRLFNWSEEAQNECLISLWRFRLLYAGEKMTNTHLQARLAGKDSTDDVLEDFVQTYLKEGNKSTQKNLIEALAKNLGEYLSQVFTNLEAVKYGDWKLASGIEKPSCDERETHLFTYPQLIDFSEADDAKIQKQILGMNQQQIDDNAINIYCYLANYLEFYDTKAYAKVLPVAFHIIEQNKSDGGYYGTRQYAELFWMASEIINEYWKILPDDEKLQAEFRKKIYRAYWPTIGDMWPIKNFSAMSFNNQNAQCIFEEAVGWIMSLDDVCEQNRELGKYLKELAGKDCLPDRALHPQVAMRVFKIQHAKADDKTWFDKAFRADQQGILAHPETTTQAKLAMECAMEYEDIGLLEQLVITGNPEKVGAYIIDYLVKHLNNLSHQEAVLLFTAACTGASSESELKPLQKFAVALKELKAVQKLPELLAQINDGLKLAQKNIKAVEFQQHNL